TAVLLFVAALIGWAGSRNDLGADAAAQMSRAASYYDSVIVVGRNEIPRGRRGDALTIGLGYLERERLGLGGPFRLIDATLRDPRLSTFEQRRVAWALIEKLWRGDIYHIDAAVLDGMGPQHGSDPAATGEAHLGFIAHEIGNAQDPRVAELSVRLSYLIAAA